MEFVPIRVSTLRGDQKTEFDIYVRIGSRHVLYLRRGDSFEGSRLQRLRDKKLRKMFIQEPDESSYRGYLQRNIEMAYDKNSGKPLSTRAEIIHGQQQANAEEVMEAPGDPEAYAIAKEGASKYVDFLLTENEALKTMLLFDNPDQNLAHHAVTVATMAVGLAAKLGIKDNDELQILTLGGLLHDIGHLNASYNSATPLADFTPDEMMLYQNHPKAGAELVADKKHFDKRVVKIILEHQELVDGSGFPNSTLEKNCEPLSIIVSACESLERLLTYEKIPRKDAIKKLMIDRVGQHPLNYIQILQSILKELDK